MNPDTLTLEGEGYSLALIAPTETWVGLTAEGYYAPEEIPAGTTLTSEGGHVLTLAKPLPAGLWVHGAGLDSYSLSAPLELETQ